MGCDSTYKYLLRSKPERMAEARDRSDLCPCDCKLVRRLNGQSSARNIQAGVASDNVEPPARKHSQELFSGQ